MSKNLISQNPIQRFKQIRKGQEGLKLFEGISNPGGLIIRRNEIGSDHWQELLNAWGEDTPIGRWLRLTDRNNIKDVQKVFNLIARQYSKDSNQIREDNLWGRQTQDAFSRILNQARSINREKGQTSVSPDNITPSIPKVEISAVKTPVEPLKTVEEPSPAKSYNRADTREYIRNRGYNPYSFSAQERREVRNRLNNGLGTAFTKPYNRRDVRQYLRNQGTNPYSLSGRERRELRNQLNSNQV